MSDIIQTPVLDQKPCPSSFYNQSPHIDIASKEVLNHLSTRDHLLGMIASACLTEVFSVHLIHKHFAVPEGRVMVYETIEGGDYPAFQICSPRKPEACENLRGYFFRASSAGVMEAYEYTTDSGMNANNHGAFVSQFANEVLSHGAQDIFALTLKQSYPTSQLHEFEMPDLASTILVKDPSWLPDAAIFGGSTSTDWAVAASGDGIISLSEYTKTRSNTHHLVGSKCTKTRSDSHYKIGSMPGQQEGKELTLDGQILTKDSLGGFHHYFPSYGNDRRVLIIKSIETWRDVRGWALSGVLPLRGGVFQGDKGTRGRQPSKPLIIQQISFSLISRTLL